MNKKAQHGPVAFVFLILVFLIIWGIWLGKFISDNGARESREQHMEGIEAFFFENQNIIVFFGLVLGIIGWMYWGSYG